MPYEKDYSTFPLRVVYGGRGRAVCVSGNAASM